MDVLVKHACRRTKFDDQLINPMLAAIEGDVITQPVAPFGYNF